MRYSRGRQAGFTMIELMVTIVVMAIIVAVAVPGFEAVINGNRLTSASNELVATLQAARAEAVRRNTRAVVCLSKTANSAAPSCVADNATDATGWISFLDANTNSAYDAGGDTLLRTGTVAGSIRLLGSAAVGGKVRVLFRSDGLPRSAASTIMAGTIAVCLPTRRPPENVRYVAIRSSRISVTSASTNAACAEPANTPANS